MKNYTECYQSQEITENSHMCCSGEITICKVCKRKMCEYHGDTFSHAMTCRTPEENKKLMEKNGVGKLSEEKNHNGLCCWYLDREDGKYKCAIKDCKRVLEKKPDE